MACGAQMAKARRRGSRVLCPVRYLTLTEYVRTRLEREQAQRRLTTLSDFVSPTGLNKGARFLLKFVVIQLRFEGLRPRRDEG